MTWQTIGHKSSYLPHEANFFPHLTCRTPALFLKEELELKSFPTHECIILHRLEAHNTNAKNQ